VHTHYRNIKQDRRGAKKHTKYRATASQVNRANKGREQARETEQDRGNETYHKHNKKQARHTGQTEGEKMTETGQRSMTGQMQKKQSKHMWKNIQCKHARTRAHTHVRSKDTNKPKHSERRPGKHWKPRADHDNAGTTLIPKLHEACARNNARTTLKRMDHKLHEALARARATAAAEGQGSGLGSETMQGQH
jgi:hypothetical protein